MSTRPHLPRNRQTRRFGVRVATLAGGLALALASSLAGRARADALGADLVAAARAGGRPPECGGTVHARAGRWERARYPGLGRYCDALARGQAALRSSPEQAIESAQVADRALPGRAAPLVLTARARVALSAWEEARQGFEKARALEKRSVEAPAALHDFAIAELFAGHPDAALAAYRELVPRAELLGDDGAEVTIFVEASVLAMSRGAEHFAEAIGYATEARRRGPPPGLGDAVLASLALALDRAGRAAEGAGIAAESSGPWSLEAERDARAGSKAGQVRPPVLPAGELDAMIAILAEKRDRDLAVERWSSYLATPGVASGPLGAHAAAHRAALARGKKPSKGTP